MANSKTWFFDIDGTLVKHQTNPDIEDGVEETLLPYTQQFVNKLYDDGHFIILTTARWESQRPQTVEMLKEFDFKYHQLIMGIGSGERIVVNDIKPVGLEIDDNILDQPLPTAYAINVVRDKGFSNILTYDFWNKPLSSVAKVWELIW
jgi:hydroxymethylpyrimidine pyrophosphatase-like HAD family hydrolase